MRLCSNKLCYPVDTASDRAVAFAGLPFIVFGVLRKGCGEQDKAVRLLAQALSCGWDVHTPAVIFDCTMQSYTCTPMFRATAELSAEFIEAVRKHGCGQVVGLQPQHGVSACLPFRHMCKAIKRYRGIIFSLDIPYQDIRVASHLSRGPSTHVASSHIPDLAMKRKRHHALSCPSREQGASSLVCQHRTLGVVGVTLALGVLCRHISILSWCRNHGHQEHVPQKTGCRPSPGFA
jgi:hypothetical protein